MQVEKNWLDQFAVIGDVCIFMCSRACVNVVDEEHPKSDSSCNAVCGLNVSARRTVDVVVLLPFVRSYIV